jgi:hypothetical protein
MHERDKLTYGNYYSFQMDVLTRQKFIQLTLRRVKPGSGSTHKFLTTRTWNKQVTDLRQLIQVSYVIVGGVATRLYMPERMTDDLDILIHQDESVQAYLSLTEQQAKKIGDLSIGGTSWELPDKTILDIITSEREWVATALRYPRIGSDGQPVISLPFLVLMKLEASRTTDISDISRMLGQASDLELDEVRKIIEMYDRNSMEDLESLIQLGKIEMS